MEFLSPHSSATKSSIDMYSHIDHPHNIIFSDGHEYEHKTFFFSLLYFFLIYADVCCASHKKNLLTTTFF